MVEFAGWRMPIQYSGLIDEHLAVRNRAGLFDVSHMGEVSVKGPEALELLQTVTCNNVAKLSPGRAQYSALTLPNGAFVDDLLVYMLGEREYMLVPNAANTDKVVEWLHRQATGRGVEIVDASPDWAQISLQGPLSESVLQPLASVDLSSMRYFSCGWGEVGGVRCLVSRTGYTGEDGFEIYSPPSGAETVWRGIVETGEPRGVVPVGLGARDTLRLEAKLMLYGNDIDDTTTVMEADLGWIVKLKKGEFIGRDVLARQKKQGVERKLVGFQMAGRPIARHGYAAWLDGKAVGQVTSGSHSPSLKKNIGLAYLPRGAWDPGTKFEVEIRGRREPAVVVSTPFYQRSST
jgi:aminomethyltransferase